MQNHMAHSKQAIRDGSTLPHVLPPPRIGTGFISPRVRVEPLLWPCFAYFLSWPTGLASSHHGRPHFVVLPRLAAPTIAYIAQLHHTSSAHSNYHSPRRTGHRLRSLRHDSRHCHVCIRLTPNWPCQGRGQLRSFATTIVCLPLSPSSPTGHPASASCRVPCPNHTLLRIAH